MVNTYFGKLEHRQSLNDNEYLKLIKYRIWEKIKFIKTIKRLNSNTLIVI